MQIPDNQRDFFGVSFLNGVSYRVDNEPRFALIVSFSQHQP
jgi:hypothetical protein